MASAAQRDVVSRECELVALFEVGSQGGEGVLVELDHGAAHLTYQVMVGTVGGVVDGAPGTEVDAVEDAEVLKGVESSVDRGDVDVGMVGLDDLGNVFRCLVVVSRREQGGNDRSTPDGHPATFGTQERQHGLDASTGVSVLVGAIRICWCRRLRSHGV